MTSNEPTVLLIVDRDNVRRAMFACTLPAEEYVLEFAKSSEAGLDLLARIKPKAVLIGLDPSTADLCQRIRQLPSGAECTLVMIDERFSDAAEGDAEVLGADLLLPFPFELTQFALLLNRKLTRRHSRVARCAPAAPNALSGSDASQENAAASSPDEGWSAFRQRVNHFYGALDGLTYYQLLEVAADASATEIKDAYFERSIEFHPDRFMQLEDQQLRKRNYQVYKRMSEAFRVLTRPDARARYDRGLAAPQEERQLRYSSESSLNTVATHAAGAAARRYLELAERAYEGGKLRSARMYLTLAVQAEPTNRALRLRLETVTADLSS